MKAIVPGSKKIGVTIKKRSGSVPNTGAWQQEEGVVVQEGVAAVDHSVVAADLDERTAPSLRSCGPTLGMLTDAGADWHRPKRLLDEGSNVHMRVIDEIRGVLFSSDLVRWASCLGINVINHTAGGRSEERRSAASSPYSAVFRWLLQEKLGETWTSAPPPPKRSLTGPRRALDSGQPRKRTRTCFGGTSAKKNCDGWWELLPEKEASGA